METLNILVIGATGKVGSATIKQLTNHKHVNIHAGVRDLAKSAQQFSDGVELVHFDLDDVSSIHKAVQGKDGILLLTGYTVDMLKQSKRVIDEANAAGVSHIVHIGASSNNTAEIAHWGWHRMIEAYIEQQDLNYTHIQPEAFMQNITAFGWLTEQSVINLIKHSVWSWVDANDIGVLAGEALARPTEFANQVWPMGYSAASMQDVAKIIGNKTGKTYELVDVDPNDFYAAAVESGADPAYMSCVRDQLILNGKDAIANAEATFDAARFEQATGKSPTAWSDFINKEF
jgi:uncharacterized protein YbjT (DUF2867 family)